MSAEIREITESYEQKQISREPTTAGKIETARYYAACRANVDQRFGLRRYIEEMPFLKRQLAKWLLRPWFIERNRRMDSHHNVDGIWAWPDVDL